MIGSDRFTMELFSRRRWRLVSAQLSNEFGYCPWCTVSIVLYFNALSLLFCIFINTTSYHLGRYDTSPPSTKELHGFTNCVTATAQLAQFYHIHQPHSLSWLTRCDRGVSWVVYDCQPGFLVDAIISWPTIGCFVRTLAEKVSYLLNASTFSSIE